MQSAAGDAGGAIGSAYQMWQDSLRETVLCFHMGHAYWGPSYGDKQISSLLLSNGERVVALGGKVESVLQEGALCDLTATAVAEGLVIGWLQGCMGWGARALAIGSILGDPRRADMKDILNLKIKRRESFRPLAPSNWSVFCARKWTCLCSEAG